MAKFCLFIGQEKRKRRDESSQDDGSVGEESLSEVPAKRQDPGTAASAEDHIGRDSDGTSKPNCILLTIANLEYEKLKDFYWILFQASVETRTESREPACSDNDKNAYRCKGFWSTF